MFVFLGTSQHLVDCLLMGIRQSLGRTILTYGFLTSLLDFQAVGVVAYALVEVSGENDGVTFLFQIC